MTTKIQTIKVSLSKSDALVLRNQLIHMQNEAQSIIEKNFKKYSDNTTFALAINEPHFKIREVAKRTLGQLHEQGM